MNNLLVFIRLELVFISFYVLRILSNSKKIYSG